MTNETEDHEKLITGIREGNPSVIREIYKQYHKAIVHFVETHNGTKEDAHDVFQEGLVIIYQKTHQKNFTLTSSFLTFFYSICKNIWHNKLRKKSNSEVTLDKKMLSIIKDEAIQNYEQSEQYFLYRKMFLKLGEDCQRVLDLFFQKVSMESIMTQMGYGSVSYTKKRKFQCKEKLVKLIQNDPVYRELRLESQ